MSKKKRSGNGVPALVYAEPSKIDEPWLLGSLLIKQSSDRNHVSLFVTTSISLPGFDKEQDFILEYAADNLGPAPTTLATNAGSCDAAWQEKIAREGTPRMHTLSLPLKLPCSVWYMSEAPSLSNPTTCPQLVEIAKANKVRLVVDFSWLQKPFQSCIRHLASGSTGLSGYPYGATLEQRFKRGDWTIFQPPQAIDKPPDYVKTSTKRSCRAIRPGSSSPPSKRAILEWDAMRIAHGIPPASPTEVATSPPHAATSPPVKRAILGLEALPLPPQSPTEVATSPSCDTTIDESSSRSVPTQPSFGTTAFLNSHYSAISGAEAQQDSHAFGASFGRFFPHPGTSPRVSEASERGSTLSSPTQFPLSLSSADVPHILPHIKKYLEDIRGRLDDHANIHLERADHQFRDYLDAKEEAKWNITVAKDEGIESLNDTRDAVLREVEDELATKADDFKEDLDTIARNIISKTGTKADETAAAIISKTDEAAAAIISEADEKATAILSEVKQMATAIMSRLEQMAKAATASSWDIATKASGDRDTKSRRPLARGKGGYRGLRNRPCRR